MNMILFNDSLLLAVNKPPGMPAQADKTGDASVLQWAETYCEQSLHPVHRIDRPASGVLLLAKTSAAMTHLQRQFQNHQVEKEYLAVVGAPPPATDAVRSTARSR